MANVDLEYGRVPNEEVEPAFQTLLRHVKSGKKSVEKRPSICTVPSVLRNLSQKSFTPRVVSIGPLHKENKNLQEPQGLKESYLHDLLSRSSSSRTLEDQLKECLEAVNHLMKEIRSCYDDAMNKKYEDTDLANMMVLDGSFILEFCYKLQDNNVATMLSKLQISCIAIDLMLLENQIPFFVLQDIFDLTKPDSISLSLTSLLHEVLLKDVHPFYISPNTEFPDEFSFPGVLNNSNHVHVLDCLHKFYQFKSSAIVDDSCGVYCSCLSKKLKTALNYNYTAVELERSGVNFKPQEDKNKAMAMKYVKASFCFWWPWRKPITFVMPTLIIQDFTEAVLRNFIAYEQLSPQVNHYFTSYSCVMNKLIDNEADVGTLVESQVLINHLGSHKHAATMIKRICKNIQIEQFYYFKQIQALDNYYNSYWIAHLRRTYFSTPWSFIAPLAGITVLVFTVVPGVYTVMSYYN